MTLEEFVYCFERNPRVNLGEGSTIKEDASGAKEYLISIKKFNRSTGDRLIVSTGTGNFTFILHEELDITELTLTSYALRQGYGRHYSLRK